MLYIGWQPITHLRGKLDELERRGIDMPRIAFIHSWIAVNDDPIGNSRRFLTGQKLLCHRDISRVGQLDFVLFLTSNQKSYDDTFGRVPTSSQDE